MFALAIPVVIGSRKLVPPLGLKFMNVPEPIPVTVPVPLRNVRQITAVGTFVAGRAEVGDAVCSDRVNALRDQAVLEHRLVGVADVVDNDLRSGGLKGLDVLLE